MSKHTNFNENLISAGVRDFSVSAEITELTSAQMDELRKYMMVAIGTAESMWRRSNEKRHPTTSEIKPKMSNNDWNVALANMSAKQKKERDKEDNLF